MCLVVPAHDVPPMRDELAADHRRRDGTAACGAGVPDASVPPEGDPAWHPKLRSLHRWWSSLRQDGFLPSRARIDPYAMPPAIRTLLPSMWMLDVAGDPPRFRYRLIGERIRDAARRDLKGRWLDEVHPAAPLARLVEVVETRRPGRRRGKPTLFYAHADHREIENLLLPLATDGRSVDAILVGTVFYSADGREM